MSTTDKRFRRGIILQLTGIGLLALTLNTYAVFFTFYVCLLLLIIGCILTLTSDASKPKRILFSFWPILSLAVIIPAVFIHSWWTEHQDMTRYEPETYLIPKGFEGGVRIRFGYDNGVATKYANERREYTVPPSGILITNSPAQVNNASGGDVEKMQEAMREYYYIQDGIRTPLTVITEQTIDSTSSTLGVFVIYGGTDFIVAPQREFPKYWIGNYEYQRHLDSLQQIEVDKLPR